MQGFILTATTAAEKCTLFLLDVNFLGSTQNFDKISGALNEGQGHRVKVRA